MKDFISAKTYKQWCKARGIDFNAHISGFPLLRNKLNFAFIPSFTPKKFKWWHKFWAWLIKKR